MCDHSQQSAVQPHAKGRPGVLAAPRLRGQEGSPEALGELPVALDGTGFCWAEPHFVAIRYGGPGHSPARVNVNTSEGRGRL